MHRVTKWFASKENVVALISFLMAITSLAYTRSRLHEVRSEMGYEANQYTNWCIVEVRSPSKRPAKITLDGSIISYRDVAILSLSQKCEMTEWVSGVNDLELRRGEKYAFLGKDGEQLAVILEVHKRWYSYLIPRF